MKTRQSDIEAVVFEDPDTLQRQILLNPRRTGNYRRTSLSPMNLKRDVISKDIEHLRRLWREAGERARHRRAGGTARRTARRTAHRPAGGTARRRARRTARRTKRRTKRKPARRKKRRR